MVSFTYPIVMEHHCRDINWLPPSAVRPSPISSSASLQNCFARKTMLHDHNLISLLISSLQTEALLELVACVRGVGGVTGRSAQRQQGSQALIVCIHLPKSPTSLLSRERKFLVNRQSEAASQLDSFVLIIRMSHQGGGNLL